MKKKGGTKKFANKKNIGLAKKRAKRSQKRKKSAKKYRSRREVAYAKAATLLDKADALEDELKVKVGLMTKEYDKDIVGLRKMAHNLMKSFA